MTTTINLYFGSGIAVGGFFLNNALINFASQPERGGKPAVNRMAPGKRPYTSMAPTIVFAADGRPMLAVGAAGGVRIPSYIAQAELGILAWKQDIATALAQPHWHNANGPSELEDDTAALRLAEALGALGHEVKPATMQSGLAGIQRTPAGWVGAADPAATAPPPRTEGRRRGAQISPARIATPATAAAAPAPRSAIVPARPTTAPSARPAPCSSAVASRNPAA